MAFNYAVGNADNHYEDPFEGSMTLAHTSSFSQGAHASPCPSPFLCKTSKPGQKSGASICVRALTSACFFCLRWSCWSSSSCCLYHFSSRACTTRIFPPVPNMVSTSYIEGGVMISLPTSPGQMPVQRQHITAQRAGKYMWMISSSMPTITAP